MEETKVHQLILVIVAVSLLISLLHYLGVGYQFGYNLSGADTLRPGRGGLSGTPIFTITPTSSPTPSNTAIKMTASVTSGKAPLTVTFTVAMTNAGCGLSINFGDYVENPPNSGTYTSHGTSEPCVVSPFGTPAPTPIPNRDFVVTFTYQTPPGNYTSTATLGTLKSTVNIEVK